MADDRRSPDPRYVSSPCRSNGHGFCSGKRWDGFDKHGNPRYSRCQCSCHRTEASRG